MSLHELMVRVLWWISSSSLTLWHDAKLSFSFHTYTAALIIFFVLAVIRAHIACAPIRLAMTVSVFSLGGLIER